MDILERFNSKVIEVENGCHEWQSALHRDGYGKFWFNDGQIQAHRMAYILFKGEIPKATMVLHTCDNRKCVNPSHLYLGDAKQNAKDRTERLGYACYKLTTEAVALIRSFYCLGTWSQQALAESFGVDQTHISRIVNERQRIKK